MNNLKNLNYSNENTHSIHHFEASWVEGDKLTNLLESRTKFKELFDVKRMPKYQGC